MFLPCSIKNAVAHINNSPGICSCIRLGHVFAPKLIPPKYFYVLAPGMCEYRHYINTEGRGQSANTYFKIIPQKYFPVFALMRIQAPHVFAQKLIPQDLFPACIGFVLGANLSEIRSASASVMYSVFATASLINSKK